MATSVSPKRVLIVDDEQAIAKALALKLAKKGFAVELALNGAEAIDQIRKGKFDVILLDLVMPEKDGFEVLEYLQKRKIKIPVLVASNLSQEDDLRRAEKLGAISYFIKADVSLQEIINQVVKV